MKDQVNSNIITKHLAGLCSKEEEKFLKEWLKKDPRHHSFFSAIQFQMQFSNKRPAMLNQHA
jgi:hypothetical protein